MSSVDKILEALDVGLQTPVPDPTFGEVSPVNSEGCWRCGATAASDSDVGLCARCRRYLAEPVPHEPGDMEIDLTPEQAQVVIRVCNDLARSFNETLAGFFSSLVGRLYEALEPLISAQADRPDNPERRRHGAAAVCPRHGTCTRCLR